MMQQITMSEAVGKTLAGSHFTIISGQGVLTFTDGTFVCLWAKIDEYEKHEAHILEGRFDETEIEESEIFRLGIMSEYERDQLSEQRQKEYNERKRQHEIAEYERLKAKFEGA